MSNLDQFQDRQGLSLYEDVKLIPRWSVALAVAGFVAMQYIWWVILPQTKHHNSPIGFRIYFSLSWSTIISLYFLTIGYVTKDAPRRAMSTRFWLMICLLMPGGPGAVLYFLLRQPITSKCPMCRTDVFNDYNFCPQCNYQLAPVCGKCHRSVRITDVYCVRCGHDLAEDNTPARLHAFNRS